MAKRNLKKLLFELANLFPEIETRDSGHDSVHIDGPIASSKEAWPSSNYYHSVTPILAFLLGKGETEISLDCCSPKDYHLLFQFEVIYYLTNWPIELACRIEGDYHVDQFPKVCEIKINNIRWLMSRGIIQRFLRVFPMLEKVEYVDNEDDGGLEEEAYGLTREDSRISSKLVKHLLGDVAYPFAW